MEFVYEVPTKSYYDGERDEVYCDTKDVFYEPDEDELLTAIAELLVNECSTERLVASEKCIAIAITKNVIKETDTQDELTDRFNTELKEYFRRYAK